MAAAVQKQACCPDCRSIIAAPQVGQLFVKAMQPVAQAPGASSGEGTGADVDGRPVAGIASRCVLASGRQFLPIQPGQAAQRAVGCLEPGGRFTPG